MMTGVGSAPLDGLTDQIQSSRQDIRVATKRATISHPSTSRGPKLIGLVRVFKGSLQSILLSVVNLHLPLPGVSIR